MHFRFNNSSARERIEMMLNEKEIAHAQIKPISANTIYFMNGKKKNGNKGEKVYWTRGSERKGWIVIDAQRILWKIEEFSCTICRAVHTQQHGRLANDDGGTANARNELMKGSNWDIYRKMLYLCTVEFTKTNEPMHTSNGCAKKGECEMATDT